VIAPGFKHLSVHMSLELAAARERGRQLDRWEPVPGCPCAHCTGVTPGPLHAPDTSAVVCPRCRQYRDAVRDQTTGFYQCMACHTRSTVSWPAGELGDVWASLPVSRPRLTLPRVHSTRFPELNVEAARGVSIIAAARRLGFTVNERRPWICCPFHRDKLPSLHLNAARGRAFCNVCARSWDAIQFVVEVRRVSFADAVRELAA
jgi:hypothetical protein